MSKLLVILGATGQQGGSIISYVLNDSVLAKEYKLRGVSRDPSTSLAQDLIRKGVEIVKADVNAPESLKNAFKDAHTVFGQQIRSMIIMQKKGSSIKVRPLPMKQWLQAFNALFGVLVRM